MNANAIFIVGLRSALVVGALGLGACSGNQQVRQSQQTYTNPASAVQAASAVGETTPPEVAAVATPESAADASEADTPTEAELDYAAIYGGDVYDPVADATLPAAAQAPGVYDPWEGFNRRVHRFNTVLDDAIARPLARAYQRVVPQPVRRGVGNFFTNLGQPVSAFNALLQGNPDHAWDSLGRFLINASVGIGGIFDPAGADGVPYHNEDFGETLAVWGWENSRFVMLPVFGPRTVRDSFGLLADAPLSPIRQVDDSAVRYGLQGLRMVDLRTQLMAVDRLRAGAVDDYALIRDAWVQRRIYQIHGDRTTDDDAALPDYLLDDVDNPTVPADVLPPINWPE